VSENVDLVRRSFEAMSAWDVDTLLRLYDPEVEFLPLTGTRVESGGYRGHEGVRAYFAEVGTSGMYWSPRARSTATSATASWWQVAAESAVVSAEQRAIQRAPG
jgi:ketosteroid isomerase-like protein